MDTLKAMGLSGYKAAQTLDTSETVISKIRHEKNKPGIEIVEKLLNNYPVISAEYLLRGNGEMLNTPGIDKEKAIERVTKLREISQNVSRMDKLEQSLEEIKQFIHME